METIWETDLNHSRPHHVACQTGSDADSTRPGINQGYVLVLLLLNANILPVLTFSASSIFWPRARGLNQTC